LGSDLRHHRRERASHSECCAIAPTEVQALGGGGGGGSGGGRDRCSDRGGCGAGAICTSHMEGGRGRYGIAEIRGHANPGTKIAFEQRDADGKVTGSVEVTITERYYHIRWAGAEYRAKKWWSWEPQSEIIRAVPELVGGYCKAKKLVVPQAERERVEAAMAEEAEAVPVLRPNSECSCMP
jgi:hypothetical protein